MCSHLPSTYCPIMYTRSALLRSLKRFPSFDQSPHIGTCFPNKSVQISSLLTARNSDELLKDLALLTSHRGVVFFTDQDIGIHQQKQLASRMGELSGKPPTSTLHRHPISEATSELGADVSIISSEGYVILFVSKGHMVTMSYSGISRGGVREDARASTGWHTDISFENVPADYSVSYTDFTLPLYRNHRHTERSSPRY